MDPPTLLSLMPPVSGLFAPIDSRPVLTSGVPLKKTGSEDQQVIFSQGITVRWNPLVDHDRCQSTRTQTDIAFGNLFLGDQTAGHVNA
jgi:hypothetical protein